MIPQPDPLAKQVLVYLGSKEAPKGYNTVFGNKMSKMPKPLTSMTFDEVVAQGKWRTDNFGSSACGRYQFMRDTLDKPNTLADLKGELKLSGSELFTPILQDGLGFHLLIRRGWLKFIAGKMSVIAFAKALAQEWASFPVLATTKGQKKQVKRGQSYYSGDGLNVALFDPDDCERFLTSIQAQALGHTAAPVAPLPVALPIGPVAAPQAVAPRSGVSVGSILASVFGHLTPGAKIPADDSVPPADMKGDPALWRIQRQLKSRNYYATGRTDGFDGTLTQEAVSQIRKDNGLEDGGIDGDFLAGLPTWGPRPVSAARSEATAAQAYAGAKENAPDLTQGVSRMWKLGAGILTLGGADTLQTSGILDSVKNVTDQGSDVLNTIQTTVASIASVISFAAQHRGLIYIALTLLAFVWAGNMALKLIIRFRTAFGL
jgi:peptidoglycan hydrolase-like protein with peptidoglycan-binding domain/muramidase (phage lysozyme)